MSNEINKTNQEIIRSSGVADMLVDRGSKITEDGRSYYFLPYWFEELADGNYIAHHLDHLPPKLVNRILVSRQL